MRGTSEPGVGLIGDGDSNEPSGQAGSQQRRPTELPWTPARPCHALPPAFRSLKRATQRPGRVDQTPMPPAVGAMVSAISSVWTQDVPPDPPPSPRLAFSPPCRRGGFVSVS
ncbi:MAG: hypothetical protein M1815_001532 [Lichina confinis]|nr:MAG: hypothetical protein M1815_001532 [Lichina confinis]